MEFFRRKGFEELRPEFEFTLQSTRLAIAIRLGNGNQPHLGLIAFGDDDFLALACFFDEAREVGLSPMDSYRFH